MRVVYLLMMSCSGLISKWSHPILPRWVARLTEVSIRNPTGSGRRSDCTSVTIEDASVLLDYSSCHMVPLGYAFEGKWWRPQHCKTNVDAHNTFRALTCPEGP